MYAGQSWFDGAAAKGVQTARRNPKRKKRLPYHAKRHISPPIMGRGGTCHHALARHEVISGYSATSGLRVTQTASYALPCQVGHKATTKNPVHKDATGRKW